jgi:hypothetical protein
VAAPTSPAPPATPACTLAEYFDEYGNKHFKQVCR